MKPDYLYQTYDLSDHELVSSIDELALWSAPFGLKLLDAIEMKAGMNVLDIGSGPGFPIIEIAQRLGTTSHVFGIDPWDAAIDRLKRKITFHRLQNVSIRHAVAEAMPFADNFFDLVVSNNGLNNVNDLDESLSECYRVAKPGAQMVITVNLPDTFIEFYTVFRQTLRELKLEKFLKKIDNHIFHKRKPVETLEKTLNAHGFNIKETHLDSFKYRFTDGTALLNYSTFRMYFLDGWKSCVDESNMEAVFEKLEVNLNSYAAKNRSIELTVPFVCFDVRRD